jgi:hypothetical protein
MFEKKFGESLATDQLGAISKLMAGPKESPKYARKSAFFRKKKNTGGIKTSKKRR